MRILNSFWIKVAGIPFTATLFLTNSCHVLANSNLSSVKNTAKQVTVAIQEVTCNKGDNQIVPCNPASTDATLKLRGSGVIVARNINTYYVLTAEHVVRSFTHYQIIAPDNSTYLVKSEDIIRIEGKDLALLPFVKSSSETSYKLATLLGHCVAEIWGAIPQSSEGLSLKFCRSTPMLKNDGNQPAIPQSVVLTSGYIVANSNRQLKIEAGVLKGRSVTASIAQSPLTGGYEYLYTNQTQDGMSGGPILDTNGQVIGIHGRLDGGSKTEFDYGYSLGIPIDAFLLWLAKASTSSSRFNQHSLIKGLEVNTSMSLPAPSTQAEVAAFIGNENLRCRNSRIKSLSLEKTMKLSNQIYKSGNTQEALNCVESVLFLNKNYPNALFAKGRLLIELGRFSEALEPLDKLTTEYSNEYAAWRWKGDALYNLQRYKESAQAFEKAIEAYEKAIETYKNQNSGKQFYQAWYGKGVALAQLGDYQSAVAAQEIVKSIEEGFSGLTALGNGYFLLANFEEARKNYEKALKLNELDLNTLVSLGRVFIQLKDYKRAIKTLNEVGEKLDKGTDFLQGFNRVALSQVWFELGYKIEKSTNTDEALKHYETSISISQNNYQAWFRKGIMQHYQEKYSDSFNSFNKALEIKSDSEELESFLLDIRELRKLCLDYDKGVTFNWVIGIDPGLLDSTRKTRENNNSSQTTTNLGSVRRFKVLSGRSTRCMPGGEFIGLKIDPIPSIGSELYASGTPWDLVWQALEEGSFERYTEVINRYPGFSLAYFHRGLSLYKAKKYKEAEEDLSRAIRINPNYSEAYSRRGIVRLALGKPKEAVEDFTKVIQLHPNYAEAYNNRGFAYSRLGDYEEAIRDFSKALDFTYGDALVYRNRGEAHSKKGDKKEALKDYQRASDFFKEQGKVGEYNYTQNLIQELQPSQKPE